LTTGFVVASARFRQRKGRINPHQSPMARKGLGRESVGNG
jgi:hypothetical protein